MGLVPAARATAHGGDGNSNASTILERLVASGELLSIEIEAVRDASSREVFGGYAVAEEIGRGSTSTVYRCVEDRTGREVAVKVFSAGDPDRFEREVRLMTRLEHPHIVRLLDSGRVGPRIYLAMALVQGENLASWIQARLFEERVRPGTELLRQVAEAIGYAHDQGVLHRDLKPANVLVSGSSAFVTDFGLAVDGSSDRLTLSGTILGTAAYMAPEQALGLRVFDPRTDVYSMGGILYELLTGRPPHLGENALDVVERIRRGERPPIPRSIQPGIPVALERLCLAALAWDPDDRPATAHEFGRELGRFR